MSDLVSRLREAAVFYADYPDLVSLLNEAAEEPCRAAVVAHMDARNNTRSGREPDDIDRQLWREVCDGGVSLSDLRGLFADDREVV